MNLVKELKPFFNKFLRKPIWFLWFLCPSKNSKHVSLLIPVNFCYYVKEAYREGKCFFFFFFFFFFLTGIQAKRRWETKQLLGWWTIFHININSVTASLNMVTKYQYHIKLCEKLLTLKLLSGFTFQKLSTEPSHSVGG